MEEGEGITITATTSSVGSPPPHSDEEEEILAVVGSPNDHLGFQEEEAAVPSASDQSSSSSSEKVVLTDDLRDKIIRQVEYYFSDENLPTDKFLMKFVKKNKEGFVPVGVIASFRKMKKLVQDSALVVAALRESSQLVVSSDGKKVRRTRPLPVTDVKEVQSRTVLVENLPQNYSMETLQKIFGDVGNIKNICIRDPHVIEDSTKCSKAEMAVSGKLHALVEYETVEAAEQAVSTLNDEKNWRSGMRVELLLKRMNKYGLAKRSWKGDVPEKKIDTQASEKAGDEQDSSPHDHHSEHPAQEEEEHLPSEKHGRRGRNRGRTRAHRQHNGQGHGHGHGHGYGHGHGNGYRHVPSASGTESLSMNKPPPGPKMPDGTKGFTMGRGRPLVGNQNQN